MIYKYTFIRRIEYCAAKMTFQHMWMMANDRFSNSIFNSISSHTHFNNTLQFELPIIFYGLLLLYMDLINNTRRTTEKNIKKRKRREKKSDAWNLQSEISPVMFQFRLRILNTHTRAHAHTRSNKHKAIERQVEYCTKSETNQAHCTSQHSI